MALLLSFSTHLSLTFALPLELACETRAANGRTKFIYVWTLRDPDKMREFIRIGVDGIIAGSTPATFDAGQS